MKTSNGWLKALARVCPAAALGLGAALLCVPTGGGPVFRDGLDARSLEADPALELNVARPREPDLWIDQSVDLPENVLPDPFATWVPRDPELPFEPDEGFHVLWRSARPYARPPETRPYLLELADASRLDAARAEAADEPYGVWEQLPLSKPAPPAATDVVELAVGGGAAARRPGAPRREKTITSESLVPEPAAFGLLAAGGGLLLLRARRRRR